MRDEDAASFIIIISCIAAGAGFYYLLSTLLLLRGRRERLQSAVEEYDSSLEEYVSSLHREMLLMGTSARPVSPKRKTRLSRKRIEELMGREFPTKLRGGTKGETWRVRVAVIKSSEAHALYLRCLRDEDGRPCWDDPVPRGILADWLEEYGFLTPAEKLRRGETK